MRCRVHPCLARDLRTVEEFITIPRLASCFWIWMLVASSFIRICFSVKGFASAGSFVGLPDRGQFSVDPVFCSLLMILVTLSRLPCRFSRLKAFDFCTGQNPSLWRQAILFLVYEVTFGMITPKLTVTSSVPRVHYMQIQVGFHGDAITHRKAFKNVSFALSLSTVFTCCLFLALAILVFLIVSK